MTKGASEDLRSSADTEKIRDAALFRALSTPHKRQKEIKVGKRKSLKRADEDIKGGG